MIVILLPSLANFALSPELWMFCNHKQRKQKNVGGLVVHGCFWPIVRNVAIEEEEREAQWDYCLRMIPHWQLVWMPPSADWGEDDFD
jgi:hypothetical protein